MTNYLEDLKIKIEPLRHEIINHKVYSLIKSVDDLKVFMQFHVYAVWDFMSLLKTLQNNLTCTQVPWFPLGNAETRFLINEIVVGEESDVNNEGTRMSHFEMYLEAMNQCGADVSQIHNFLNELKQTGSLEKAYLYAEVPRQAAEFVDFTFKVINSKKAYLQASIFTFGREDLIPGMFVSLINDLHKNIPDSISGFKYYLERHIEIDGDHHSHLALKMTESLCGNNENLWKEAEQFTIESLQKRINLWNGVYDVLHKNQKVLV